MSKVIKAKVIKGRYSGEVVRITNVSADELGRKKAACFLSRGARANIPVDELEIIPEAPEPEPVMRHAKTSSMPFIGGSTSSRTMTHTKNMAKPRMEKKTQLAPKKVVMVRCETCSNDYNLEERKGMPGKITQCENCAVETENKVEGKMIFSHKTGATIEIKKDGELRHEADIFDPKNKL